MHRAGAGLSTDWLLMLLIEQKPHAVLATRLRLDRHISCKRITQSRWLVTPQNVQHRADYSSIVL